MKAHIGADAESGLLHTARGASGHASDIAEGNTLLHAQEAIAFDDAGYQGIDKRADAKTDVTWHIAMRPGKRKALDKDILIAAATGAALMALISHSRARG